MEFKPSLSLSPPPSRNRYHNIADFGQTAIYFCLREAYLIIASSERERKREEWGESALFRRVIKFLSPDNSRSVRVLWPGGKRQRGLKFIRENFTLSPSLRLFLSHNASAAAIHILRYLTGISRAAARSCLFAHDGLKAIDRSCLSSQHTKLPLSLSLFTSTYGISTNCRIEHINRASAKNHRAVKQSCGGVYYEIRRVVCALIVLPAP